MMHWKEQENMENKSSAFGTSDRKLASPVQDTDVGDLKKWLQHRGIKINDARSTALAVRRNYPYLSDLLRQCDDVRPELDLILLIKDTVEGRFPAKE